MKEPKTADVRRQKIDRMRSGSAPRVLELCSGCGGLSLGLVASGFELAAHIEMDEGAAASYALNFGADRKNSSAWSAARDMVKCSPDDLVSELELTETADSAFDVLAAGLPCQAFARIGRSKLREIAKQKNAYQQDPRAALYRRFLEYVEMTRPLAIIIENVPDILNFGGHNVPEEICESLEIKGYRTGYTIMNAAFYGVPQVRERLFIIGLAEELGVEPTFPEPTHYLELPKGYEGSRRVALKHVDRSSGRFHAIHEPDKTLPRAVSVTEALADLPIIFEHKSDPRAMRRRRLDDSLSYRSDAAPTAYSSLMKSWPGLETTDTVNGHLVRITPRDFPIFSAMRHGADYPEARRLAEHIFEQTLAVEGLDESERDNERWQSLYKSIVPPYDPGKFPNKWWKLEPDKPSRTLTAHIGKDTYSHIHYDGLQSRTISVREAARLQSFPDGFRFSGAMNAAFKQIGNAVPPLLGKALAGAVKEKIMEGIAALPASGNRKAA